MSELLLAIRTAVVDGDQQATVAWVGMALEAGLTPQQILAGGLVAGMQQLGERFKSGQAFLPEILTSCRAMSQGMDLLRPHLSDNACTRKGTVVIGTVEGDLHDIGKKLVAMLLSGNGFNVIDLGVDVSPEAFVDATRESDADVVALSALLTTTTPRFSEVIDALSEAGLRDKTGVMVGGAPVSEALAVEMGADGFAPDCITAVDEAGRLVAERRTP